MTHLFELKQEIVTDQMRRHSHPWWLVFQLYYLVLQHVDDAGAEGKINLANVRSTSLVQDWMPRAKELAKEYYPTEYAAFFRTGSGMLRAGGGQGNPAGNPPP